MFATPWFPDQSFSLNVARLPKVVEEVEGEHSVRAQQEKPLPGAARDVTLHEDDGEGEDNPKPMCHWRTPVVSLLDCRIQEERARERDSKGHCILRERQDRTREAHAEEKEQAKHNRHEGPPGETPSHP